ncbi:MAG: alpha/beta hydrolase [Mycobacteriaceae bacterium]
MSSPSYERTDVTFSSQSQTCAAWLYRPKQPRVANLPIVVLGHGLGAIKEMGLDAYASRFAEAGYAALVFDYRHFGASQGEPRQLLDVKKQRQDWQAAIAFARTIAGVDPSKVAIFGTSFGGGHVLVTAAKDAQVAAVIAQCPFTSGSASARTLGVGGVIGAAVLAISDNISRIFGRKPVRINLAGPAGSIALMNAPDVEKGYLSLVPKGTEFTNAVAARVALDIPLRHPGRAARKVAAPVLFCICDQDSVAPVKPTLRYAKSTQNGTVIHYPVGHFDIYVGEAFEGAIKDQIAFLQEHVPVG